MNSVADQTVVRLKNFRSGAGKRISNAAGSVAGQVLGAAKSTNGFVHSNPWQAVGAMALAGVVAGLLVSRGARHVRRQRTTHDKLRTAPGVAGG